MKFAQRFAYYLVGLVIGLFFVALVFSGKDTRCNYFPNARVLNDIRNKPFDYSANADYNEGKVSFMDLATPNLSVIIFWVICFVLAIATVIKKYSLIPLMGVTTCLYLLTGMTKSNWAWFLGWLGVGLIIYFIYGYKKSKLAVKQ